MGGGFLKIIGYFSLGYPSIEDSLKIASHYINSGINELEVDVPSPDPYFESQIIAHNMKAAFSLCPDYEKYFEGIKWLRYNYPDIPVQLTLYDNTITKIGIDKTLDFCKRSDINSIILVGVEHPEYRQTIMNASINLISFVRYHLPAEDVSLAKLTDSCVYLQAKPTFSNNVKPGYERLEDCIVYLRDQGIKREIYCGIGIYHPNDVRLVKQAGADGVYIGSVLLELQGNLVKIRALIEEMKRAATEE